MAVELEILRVEAHDRQPGEDQLRLPRQEHKLHHHGPLRGELVRPCLLHGVEVEVGAEEELEEADVEEVAVDGVVPGDGVAEPHAVVVRGPVDAHVVEQVRQVGAEELAQPLRVGRRQPLVPAAPILLLLLRRRRRRRRRRGHRAAGRRRTCREAEVPPPGRGGEYGGAWAETEGDGGGGRRRRWEDEEAGAEGCGGGGHS